MKKSKVYMYLLTLILLGLGWMGVSVEAEEMPVSIKAILPENQFNKKVTYFDLMMKPKQEQDLVVQLFNSSKEEVEVGVKLYSTMTNDNGVLDYSLEGKKYDKSLKHPFPEIASSEVQVKIPANQKKDTKIHIKMPDTPYDGIILGGINVRLIKKESKEDDAKKVGMKIVNELRYTVGVLLRENENKIDPDMKLKKVYASQVSSVNTIKANIQNPTPDVIEHIKYVGKIYKETGKDVLYESKKEEYRMAPNSNFNYLISLGKKPFKAGKYRLELTAHGRDRHGNNKEWKFQDVFVITRERAKKLNEEAAELEKPDYTLYYVLGAVLVLILAGIFVYIRMKKQQKELVNKLNKSTSKSKSRKRKSEKKKTSSKSNASKKSKDSTKKKSSTRKKKTNRE